MAGKYKSFPGMEDILPGDVEKWQWLESQARLFYEARSYREIRTPALEATELFSRSIGESSDIVHKEMYTFEDRGGRSMTLRPEMTASVARAVIQHGLLKTSPSLRLYYMGPMFRAERPQAGRKRQFHQFGVEIVNEGSVEADVELLADLYFFLKSLGIEQPRIRLNDLSSVNGPDGAGLRERLSAYFLQQKTVLCRDCCFRLEKNVMRIFDCKNSSCQPVIDQAPWEDAAPLSEGFRRLLSMLETGYSIDAEVNRRLVRGLDYYTGMVFEIIAEGLGAQNAVAGGGRYDHLYAELGGKATPCTGFSIGLERLLMTLDAAGASPAERVRANLVYFAPLWDKSHPADAAGARKITETVLCLRKLGVRAEAPPSGEWTSKLSYYLKRANKMGARYVVIAGPDELQQRAWTVKDMNEGTQSLVSEGKLFETLKGHEFV